MTRPRSSRYKSNNPIPTINTNVDAVGELIRRGRADGAWFIESVFGVELWAKQREIASAVLDVQASRVAVRSCHSSGKTFLAAQIALAFSMMYPGSRVITTAPTFSQVKKLLWPEIATAYNALPNMGATLNGTELVWCPNHFILGLSTNEAERFQGHHADDILLVFDEAPGVRSDIYEAAMGNLAGGNSHLLLIGNPTETSGPFYNAFTSERERFANIAISAWDTPNLYDVARDDDGNILDDEEIVSRLLSMSADELDANPFPYLTTRRWVLEAAQTFGVGSAAWYSRVLGDFPLDADDSLLPLRHVEASVARHDDKNETKAWLASLGEDHDAHCDDPETIQIGVDVAGPGTDETVVMVRQGRRIVAMEAWAGSDTRGAVVAYLEPWRKYGPLVCVDDVGIGHYFAAALKDAGFKVAGVNVGRPPIDKQRFANWKAELFWSLREKLMKGQLDIPNDEKLVAQASSVKYEYTGAGKIQIETKDQLRRRGAASPDRLEALMLSASTSSRLSLSGKRLRKEILI